MLDPVIKNDLLIRLTDLPYWIDESGAFDPLDSCSYDYWTEDDQLSWLSGGYLVGKCVLLMLRVYKCNDAHLCGRVRTCQHSPCYLGFKGPSYIDK